MSEAVEAIDRIREVELTAARRVEEAHRRAEEILSAARAEANAIRSEARRQGKETARRHFEACVGAAEQEAAEVLRLGEEEAGRLVAAGDEHIEAIKTALVAAVLAPPLEEGK